MLLVWLALLLAAAAGVALIPTDRLPTWVNVYLGVAIGSALLVVVVALLT